MSNIGKRIVRNNRLYEIDIDNNEETSFKDISFNEVKVNFSFSKDPKKNANAKKALEELFTEILKRK